MIEHIEGAGNVDFQCRRNVMGFLFVLCHQGIVQVFQDGHILRARIVEIGLIDLPHGAVDHGLLNGFQTVPAADNQLTQGQDEIAFQRKRGFIVGVVEIDVHGIDVIPAGRRDMDDLPLQLVHQREVFAFRIADNNVILGNQEQVDDFTLGSEGLTGTGRTEDQTIRVLQELPIHHDDVVRQSIQAVIKRLAISLKQLLRGERHKNRGGRGGKTSLNLDLVQSQRERRHQSLLLPVIQRNQRTVVLLGNALRLHTVDVQLPFGVSSVHNQEGQQEHALIMAL